MNNKPVVLILADYYIPGFKAGGPIRSIQSICDALYQQCDIYLITRDRDIGSTEPYKDISPNKWSKVGDINVMYKVEGDVSISFMRKIFKSIQPDVIHLNSLMSIRFSFIPLLGTLFEKSFAGKILLSPRGELSDGALKLKKYKKKLYLKLFELLKLHHRVEWITSSDGEKQDVYGKFGKSEVIIHRVDNIPNFSQWEEELIRLEPKNERQLRLVFFSRISPMKNLAFLLHQLKDFEFDIQLSIYGPQEDMEYFNTCSKIVSQLPHNVGVEFLGALSPSRVYSTLKEFDLFVLPTLGENFGQAIWEALASSVPILISERTPWKNLQEEGVGWDIDLENPAEFKEVLKKMHGMSESQHQYMRSKCRNFALEYVEQSNSLILLKNLYKN